MGLSLGPYHAFIPLLSVDVSSCDTQGLVVSKALHHPQAIAPRHIDGPETSNSLAPVPHRPVHGPLRHCDCQFLHAPSSRGPRCGTNVAMAIARPVRALLFFAAVVWCFFLYQIFKPDGLIRGPGARYQNFERDPTLDRELPRCPSSTAKATLTRPSV